MSLSKVLRGLSNLLSKAVAGFGNLRKFAERLKESSEGKCCDAQCTV